MMPLLRACPLTSPEGCSYGRSPGVLKSILKDEINLALWKRSVPDELLDWGKGIQWHNVKAVEADVSSINLVEFILRLGKEVSRWTTTMPKANAWVVEDVKDTISHFMMITGARRVGVRIAPVDTDMCRLFHVDHNLLRLLCTYVGKGTQWLSNDNVYREQLGNAAGLNDRIMVNPQQVYQAETLDVLVLKGSRWPFIPSGGAVHRSPPLSSNEKRILLRLDYLE